MADGRKNLIPVRTTEEAKAKGKRGGIQSGIAKREKALLSSMYADILAEQTGQIPGMKFKDVVRVIIQAGGAPAVSMLKEIREATEGSKVKVDGQINIIIDSQDDQL